MKKNGFTLVELLAVIVIFAVILVIAVPKVTDVINNTKKSSIESTLKMIVTTAEKEYTSREILGTLDQDSNPIECSDIVNLSMYDYDICNITFSNGMATVTLFGKGKFDGNVCYGDKNIIECGDSQSAAMILKISGDMYQDDTEDKNYRYKGSNPKNYVSFNGEKWRIIGIFKVRKSFDGEWEQRIKIIGPSLGDYSWDTNKANGYNIWETKSKEIYKDNTSDRTTKADVNELLNTLYYEGASITCYCGNDNATKTCPTSKINTIAKEMTDDAVWNLGGTPTNAISPNLAYMKEKGKFVYLPTIAKAEWIGRVGLIYASDYGYATDNCNTLNLANCKTNNWLYPGRYSNLWVITPKSDSSFGMYYAAGNGDLGAVVARGMGSVRPVMYLKSDIKITSGDGTYVNPYVLSI